MIDSSSLSIPEAILIGYQICIFDECFLQAKQHGSLRFKLKYIFANIFNTIPLKQFWCLRSHHVDQGFHLN